MIKAPKGKRVDQVSIAVHNIEQSLVFYRDVLGLPLEVIEEVPSEKVKVAILWADVTRVELLEPTAEDSPISKFLAKRGEGVHHIAYRVENLEQAVEEMQKQGIKMIEPLIRSGSEGAKIAFVHPKSTHGVLTELVER
jgi:methylmalonyl-CoA/ethylmalonyl-CoA epimerase